MKARHSQIFLFLIFLSGCSAERQRADVFERSMKCAQQWEQLKREMTDNSGTEASSFADQIFYSPVLDTCVAAYHVDLVKTPDIYYILRDNLTHMEIHAYQNNADLHAKENWQAKIAELKKNLTMP